MSKTVREWIESHCSNGIVEFENQIHTYADKKIVLEISDLAKPFPQQTFKYRNVYNWVLLEDGTSVGWNESPRTGWSFPRSGKRITEFFVERYKVLGTK